MSDCSVNSDVAIIGLSGLFAGCRDKNAFWRNIINKVDNIKEAPDSWAKPYYDPALAGVSIDNARIATRKVGLIGEHAVFNPFEFGVAPRAVEGDPAHFLALQLAGDALKDSGYDRRPFNRERTGIIVGHGTNPNRGDAAGMQYGLVIDQTLDILRQLLPNCTTELLESIREALKKSMPKMELDQAPSLISNVISGRIANRLDLMGPNYLVDAACSSSLIAVDLAIKDLLGGRCDMMIAGGVQGTMPAQIYMLFETLGAISASNIRPFDRAANGTLLSEGVGFVVLKRLADAIRDSDRIYALIKGVGLASDGKAMGLLAPRLEGETAAIQRAYEQTGIDPETIGLVEAHGTGILLGDQTEIQALRNVFGPRKRRLPSCALGSVKSMIGHCIPASGSASLIKMALSLYYKTLPPTLCNEVNPELGIEATPFYINTETRPWIHGENTARRASINAFGFGGINAHAILEEYRESADCSSFGIGRWLTHSDNRSLGSEPCKTEYGGLGGEVWCEWPTELVLFSAGSREKLFERIKSMVTRLEQRSDIALAALAYALSRAAEGPLRLAVVASDIEDLIQKLNFVLEKLDPGKQTKGTSRKGIYYSEAPINGQVAFCFSSEGSQYPNMLAELCLYFPKVRKWFDFLDQTFPRAPKPSECIFPPPTGLSEEQRDWVSKQLYAGDLATESVSTASQAIYELLRDLGIQCDLMVGHSAGEHAALRASGKAGTRSMKHLREEMRLLNEAYRQLGAGERIVSGTILSVGAMDYDRIGELLRRFPDSLYRVADNCPDQVLLFAKKEFREEIVEAIRDADGISMELPFDRAYHTPLFANGVEVLKRFYENGIHLGAKSIPVYSCGTTDLYPDDLSAGVEIAAQQWVKPVRFRETIEKIYDQGTRIFVEIGASNSLTAFIDNILKGKEYLAIAADIQGKHPLEQFQQLLGRLFVNGVGMDPTRMYGHRAVERIDLEQSEIKKPKMLNLVLNMELPKLSIEPEFAAEIRRKIVSVEPLGSQASPSDHNAVISSHFALMQEFLRSQSRVAEALSTRLGLKE